MAQDERWHTRNTNYSWSHRAAFIGQFMDRTEAAMLCMQDIDAVDYCCNCGEPLAFIETAVDIGQEDKPNELRLLKWLARTTGRRAFLVFYKPAEGGVERVRVRQVWPVQKNPKAFWDTNWKSWIEDLRKFHLEHHKTRPDCARWWMSRTQRRLMQIDQGEKE